MEKTLVRVSNAQVKDLPENIIQALKSFNETQLDRYYRAAKVWYNQTTGTFEFEDTLF